jgi:hypothetical protein
VSSATLAILEPFCGTFGPPSREVRIARQSLFSFESWEGFVSYRRDADGSLTFGITPNDSLLPAGGAYAFQAPFKDLFVHTSPYLSQGVFPVDDFFSPASSFAAIDVAQSLRIFTDPFVGIFGLDRSSFSG